MNCYLIFHFISDYFGTPNRINFCVVTEKKHIEQIINSYKECKMFEKSDYYSEYDIKFGLGISNKTKPKTYWSYETIALITNIKPQ